MEELREAIDAAADPGAAAELARYFQVRPGGYGEGDVFVGVPLSRLRELVRPHLRRPYADEDWLPLLTSTVHEHRLAALVAMAERAGRGDMAELERIYRSYLAHTDRIDNWDLVDVSAAKVVGRRLLDRDRAPLDPLVRSPSRWERRIAVVATHWFIRFGTSADGPPGGGDDADVYRFALVLREDPEDLIHKALGWMLREAGRRVSAERLRAFLDRYAAELPRTTVRYAIEHFPPEVRRAYLTGSRRPRGPEPPGRMRR